MAGNLWFLKAVLMTLYDRFVPVSRRSPASRTIFLIFATTCGVLAVMAPHPAIATGFMAASVAFGLAFLGSVTRQALQTRRHKNSIDNISLLIEHDVTCCLLTDHDGLILNANRSAGKTLKASKGQTLRDIIGAHVAEPGNELLEVTVKKEQIARVCSPKRPCRVSCYTIRRSGFSFSRRGRSFWGPWGGR